MKLHILALSLLAGSASAGTVATLSADGTLQNFSGFDWHSNGSALIQGYDLAHPGAQVGDTDTFVLTYQAFAAGVFSTSTTPNMRVATPGAAVGTYEFTTIGTLYEKATCTQVSAFGCTRIDIETNYAGAPNPSTWSVFLDETPDADPVTGSGFMDGHEILKGVWSSGESHFQASTSNILVGLGLADLQGTVTAIDGSYVSGNFVGTDLNTTLRFPGIGGWTRPAQVAGIATPAPGSLVNFVEQVDASQPLTEKVPEPATLALAGLGLMAMGSAYRKRK